MVQPSHPQGSDPLATRIDIWPYIHKICIYLALEKAILYRKHMQLFEDGAIDEATLWSKTYDVGIFDYDLHTELTHVKLVVMINKANDKVQAPAAAEPTVSGIAPVRNSPELQPRGRTLIELPLPPPSPPMADIPAKTSIPEATSEKPIKKNASESVLTKGKRSTQGPKSSHGVEYHEDSD
ncbi:hypothetical protein PMIN07_002865 [Paraphaeosphaeria minitans]